MGAYFRQIAVRVRQRRRDNGTQNWSANGSLRTASRKRCSLLQANSCYIDRRYAVDRRPQNVDGQDEKQHKRQHMQSERKSVTRGESSTPMRIVSHAR
jgi:hypothetical protein